MSINFLLWILAGDYSRRELPSSEAGQGRYAGCYGTDGDAAVHQQRTAQSKL